MPIFITGTVDTCSTHDVAAHTERAKPLEHTADHGVLSRFPISWYTFDIQLNITGSWWGSCLYGRPNRPRTLAPGKHPVICRATTTRVCFVYSRQPDASRLYTHTTTANVYGESRMRCCVQMFCCHRRGVHRPAPSSAAFRPFSGSTVVVPFMASKTFRRPKRSKLTRLLQEHRQNESPNIANAPVCIG